VSSCAYFTGQNQSLAPAEVANWYAIQTMSRHERVVAHQLENQGITILFPTFTEVHHWSDRSKKVELALFPGYLFAHVSMSSQVRRVVLFARGVAGLITMRGEPIPIPDEQIESVQKLLANNVRCVAYPFLRIGQRVRIRGGALEGVQGILTARDGHKGLVVSIDGIQRSLAVRIEGYDLEAL
jgi:transcription antitermination factor NusG